MVVASRGPGSGRLTMKKNLLDYLDEDKEEKKDESPEEGEGGESLGDTKSLLLLMKADSTHEPMKRAKAMLAAIKCVMEHGNTSHKEAYEDESEDEE